MHVHKNKNCEDIAMQFMVSNLTGLPPIWVQGSYSDSGVLDFKGGISTGANHYEVRFTHLDIVDFWFRLVKK
jgi:glucuronyl/N-acetylglucosaminyl transferase EXT2